MTLKMHSLAFSANFFKNQTAEHFQKLNLAVYTQPLNTLFTYKSKETEAVVSVV